MEITKNQLKLRNRFRRKLKMHDEPWAEVIAKLTFNQMYYDKGQCECGHVLNEIYELKYKKYFFQIGKDCINQFVEHEVLFDTIMKAYHTINKSHSKKIPCGKLKGTKYKEEIKNKGYCENLLYIRRREGEVYTDLVSFLDYYVYYKTKASCKDSESN